jgi:hypothetical protein
LTIAKDYRPEYVTMPIESLRQAQTELRVLRLDRTLNSLAKIILADDCEEQLLASGVASVAPASADIVLAWKQLLLSVAVCAMRDVNTLLTSK